MTVIDTLASDRSAIQILLNLETERAKKQADQFSKGLTSGFNRAFAVFAGYKVIEQSLGQIFRMGKKAWEFLEKNSEDAQKIANGIESSFAEVAKSIGETILDSDAAKSVFASIQESASALSDFIRSPEGKKAVDEFFQAFRVGSVFVVDAAASIVALGQGALAIFNKQSVALNAIEKSLATTRFNLESGLGGAFKVGVTNKQKKQLEADVTELVKIREGMSNAMAKLYKKEEDDYQAMVDSITSGSVELANSVKSTAALQRDGELELLRNRKNFVDKYEGQSLRLTEIDKKTARDQQQINADKHAQWEADQAVALDKAQQFNTVFGAGFQNLGYDIVNSGVGNALANFAASAIDAMGTMLIQAGTFALFGGELSTVIPFLKPLLGGPAGVGVGLAAIAAGVGLKAVAASIGNSTGSGSAGRQAYVQSQASSRAVIGGYGSQGQSAGLSGGAQQSSTTVNVKMGRGFIVGSERRLAREMKRVLLVGGT